MEPSDPPKSPQATSSQAPSLRDPDDIRMSLGEHLDELRSRVIRGLVGLLLMTIACFVWAQDLLGLALRPAFIVLQKYHQQPALQSLSPPDTFLVYVKISLLSGLIFSSPWILYQAWQFIATGLYDSERRYVRRFIPTSLFLFVLGVTFMYLIVLPIMMNFFARFNQGFPAPNMEATWLERQLIGDPDPVDEVEVQETLSIPMVNGDPQDPLPNSMWFNQKTGKLKIMRSDGRLFEQQFSSVENATAVTNQYSIDFYVTFILRLSLAFGLAFQLPVVVVFLALTGIVSIHQMAKARGYVILGIAITAAVLTPPDIFSQVFLAIPMMLLFEIGLVVSRIKQGK